MIAFAKQTDNPKPIQIGRPEMLRITWLSRGMIRVAFGETERITADVPAAALASPGDLSAAIAGETGILLEWTREQLADWQFSLRKAAMIGALGLKSAEVCA